MARKETVNLLANAYGGSNPPLPTRLIMNDLGSQTAPHFFARKGRVGSLWAHFLTSSFGLGQGETQGTVPLA